MKDIIKEIEKEHRPDDYIESEVYKFNYTLLAHEKTIISLSKLVRELATRIKELEKKVKK